MSESFTARLAQAKLATKTYFDDKLKKFKWKSYSKWCKTGKLKVN